MHYLGFVVVDEPTQEALDKAMDPFYEKEWDWFRAGGRWDGYLEGPEEVKRRETHNGFNYGPQNEQVSLNVRPTKDFGAGDNPRLELETLDMCPYFFVAGGNWIKKQFWDETQPDLYPGSSGNFSDTPNYREQLLDALKFNPNGFVIVVDVHN